MSVPVVQAYEVVVDTGYSSMQSLKTMQWFSTPKKKTPRVKRPINVRKKNVVVAAVYRSLLPALRERKEVPVIREVAISEPMYLWHGGMELAA